MLANIGAMRQQESLCRGALVPQLALDDPHVGTNSVGEYRQKCQPDANKQPPPQQSPPHYALNHQRMHSGEVGGRVDPQQTPDSRSAALREQDYLTSPEMIALWQRQCEDLDAVREETQAQSAAVSGSEWAPGAYQDLMGAPYFGDPCHAPFYGDPYPVAGDLQGRVAMDHTQMYPGAPFHPGAPGLCCPPVGRNLASPTPSVASQPVLDREAGGGTGLAGKAAPAQMGAHWVGTLHDRTNVQAVDTSGFISDHDAWSKFAAGAAEYTDGRSDDELPLCGCAVQLCCFHICCGTLQPSVLSTTCHRCRAFAQQQLGKGRTASVLPNTMLQKIQQKVRDPVNCLFSWSALL